MSASSNHLGYSHYCKYCDVYPITEGPHHNKHCPRHKSVPSHTSELANKYKCKFCGVKPFVAGNHHKHDCKRYLPF